MKYKFMNNQEILSTFSHQRRHSPRTTVIYERTIRKFEEWSGMKFYTLFEIAQKEQLENVQWINSTLRPILLEYRAYLYDKYSVRTAEGYHTKLMTILRHFEIVIPPLPYFSLKNARRPDPIYPEDLPDRDILTKVLTISNPLMKAAILLMSSSGIGRIDTLNLTIGDYLEATQEYHHCNNILDAIVEMQKMDNDIIPEWHLERQKTGEKYFTFSSPESTRAINAYIWSREERLYNDGRLFKVEPRYFNTLFQKANDMLRLGRKNNRSRFTPQSLRQYHATQLAASGMSGEYINMLEGRKNTHVLYKSYVRISPEVLREQYINALPYLVVEEIEKVRTELDIVKDENEKLQQENLEYQDNLNNIWTELHNIKTRQDAWEQLKKE